MSVINKMLRDLETRKFQAEEVNADYHLPPEKQSNSLIKALLILVSVVIIFALMDKGLLFNGSKHTVTTASVITNKMAVLPKKNLQNSLQPPLTATQTLSTELELEPQPRLIATDVELPSNLTNEEEEALLDTPVPASSFSMSGNSSEDSNISNLKQRIAESLNDESVDLAQSLLKKLLLLEPDNIKARKKLASLLFAQGNTAQSTQLLKQGIKLHPTQSDLRLMLARLYVAQKESLQAISLLAEFQPSTTHKIEYLAYRATLAQQLKQTELAISDYQTLTNVEPDNARWWLGLAIIRDQSGESSMALQAYDKANKLGQLGSSISDFIQQRILVLAGVP